MIPFQRPSLPPSSLIEGYLNLSREAHTFSNGGPCWSLLRDRLSDRVGAYCVPVASGTLGLMVALTAIMPRGGSQGNAAMPSFTFIATAQAAIWAGLKPLLFDIDPDHWHLDPTAIEKALGGGPNFDVLLAVSAFGTPPSAETRQRWERACRAAGVPLVVDSAAGFGAVAEDGVPVGAQGDVEVVSFHATKPFAIGEGGAVFTRDRELHERVQLAVNFGFRPDRSVAFEKGLNAKMSELHAAVGLAVLDGFDDVLARRRSAAASIRERGGKEIGWQAGSERSTWQFLPVAFADTSRRDAALAACQNRIETRFYYEPLDALLPAGTVRIGDDLEATADLDCRILCLPLANDLSTAEAEVIGAAIGPT